MRLNEDVVANVLELAGPAELPILMSAAEARAQFKIAAAAQLVRHNDKIRTARALGAQQAEKTVKRAAVAKERPVMHRSQNLQK